MPPDRRISLRTFINGLPDNFLECRADGHGPWRALTVRTDGRGRSLFHHRKRRCGNCGTIKPQVLDYEGFIVDVQRGGYEYPNGYLAINVDLPEQAVANAAYRLAWTRRQMALEPRRRSA